MARLSIVHSALLLAIVLLAVAVSLIQGAQLTGTGEGKEEPISVPTPTVASTGTSGPSPLRKSAPAINGQKQRGVQSGNGGDGGNHGDHDGDGDGNGNGSHEPPGSDSDSDLCECNCRPDQLVHLYRYRNTVTGSILLTIDQADPVAAGVDYVLVGVMADVFGSPVPGTVPVYRYYYAPSADHFYTTNPSVEILGAYTFIGIAFYIDVQVRCSGEVPVFRYWNGITSVHDFTLDFAVHGGSGSDGYGFESIPGFVFPPTTKTTEV